jgi:excisionase family DNA binding protein
VRKVRIEDSTGGDRGNGAAQPALLTVRQAADMLTVSTRKVYNLITAGKLPHYRIDNAIRVAVADVEDYLASCRITCPAVVEPMPEENRQRAQKPRAGQTPVRTSHLTIGPRQLSLLRRGGVAISGPSDRSGR